MTIARSINELERLGFNFYPVGQRLHYEFTGEASDDLPADRIRQLLEELGGCVAEVLEHLRTRHRPPARWVPRQAAKLVAAWPRGMWPVTLYRQGEAIEFNSLGALRRRTFPGHIWTEGDDIVLMLDYSRTLVEQIKALPLRARRWHPDRKVWTVRQDYRPNLEPILLDQYGVGLAELLGEKQEGAMVR